MLDPLTIERSRIDACDQKKKEADREVRRRKEEV